MVVVAVSAGLVVSLAAAVVVVAAVGSVEVSAAAVVVVSPPPLIRPNSEPIPLQPLQEHPVMETAVIRAVAAQMIFNNFGFFFIMVTPQQIVKLMNISAGRTGISQFMHVKFMLIVISAVAAAFNVEDTFLSRAWYPVVHGVWSGWIQVLIPVFYLQTVLALIFVIAGRNTAWLTVINERPVMASGIQLLVSVFYLQAARALVFVIAVGPTAWSAVIYKCPIMAESRKYIIVFLPTS